MDIIFLGTPQFSIQFLESLNDEFNVIGVITQPDKPSGRNLKLKFSPVKSRAEKLNLTILQPDDLKKDTVKKRIIKLNPRLGVVVAYGKIIPKWMLKELKYGCINVHPSLLPKYRGAAPIQRAIMDGKNKTGVSIIQMDEGLDTGDILGQIEVIISDSDSSKTLSNKIIEKGKKLLLRVIKDIERQDARPIKQDDDKTSYASRITQKEARIKWEEDAETILNLIKALNPKPGAYTYFRKKRLKIWRAEKKVNAIDKKNYCPGTILYVDNSNLIVSTASDLNIQITELQPEGKKRMTAREFMQGYRPLRGEVFD